MTQRWQNLLFVHWAYEPEVVRKLLPGHLFDSGVQLDCFGGRAYVGLIPFEMQDLRLRGMPRIPTTANFAEINVRTYVRYKGRPAVWFFSLDTDRILPTAVARAAFRLPYCYARTSVTVTGSVPGSIHATTVARRWPDVASTSIAARVGPPVEASPLASFLTARWGLVTTNHSRRESTSTRTRQPAPVWFGAVDHEPWPLHEAALLHLDDGLIGAAGLPAPEGDPHLLYSPGVSTTVYSLERVGALEPERRR